MPSTNPSDTQKLNQALMKYRSALETGQKRDKAIRDKLDEMKAGMQKRQSQIAQAQRAVQSMVIDVKRRKHFVEEAQAGRQLLSNHSSDNRVADSIDLLNAAADLRRDQFNHKRNSSTSSAWVQSLPSLPGPLKRSLWYKMHRRRQQVVLRPTFTSLLEDLRKHVGEKHKETPGMSDEAIEAELIRAEQSYLLATHPIKPREESLSSIPVGHSWAEPGKPVQTICVFLFYTHQDELLSVTFFFSLSPPRLALGLRGSQVDTW